MIKQDVIAQLTEVTLSYGRVRALDNISVEIPAGCRVGLIGPDGVGKSSLLSLISGSRAIQSGSVYVLDGDMGSKRHRDIVCPKIAYMPQGLGKNLYPTLSVEENLQFFGRLFGHNAQERRRRIDELTKSTGMYKFLDRPAGKLSGGMKQKLGLCCALIHDPDLLILDEPTTGVDPLARAQFWDLIDRIRLERPSMSVIVATAYMDEAQRFDWLIAMDDGKILQMDTPDAILKQTNSDSLETAFIRLLPEEKRKNHKPVVITPYETGEDQQIAIEAKDLTKKFGNFVAVDHVNFRIRQGEIFGFLGSNGCGKSTTMKMLTGLLDASEGKAWLFGKEVDPKDINTRRRVGYMSQAFSLYSELTVFQNLELHARLFHVPEEKRDARVQEMVERFGLKDVTDSLPENLPLGIRQRLSLAVAMVHQPELLILDEPTSGVDPIARDGFWRLLIELSRRDKVTIFISTHFMNEAERCDRMSLMHAGKVLISDTPAKITESKQADTLEQAFIEYLIDAGAGDDVPVMTAEEMQAITPQEPEKDEQSDDGKFKLNHYFSPGRLVSYMWQETLELRRDPVRASLALFGSLILMFVIGFGISMDVEDLSFAVLDRDRTGLSENYTLNIAGSRYFIEKDPLTDYDEMDRRMRSGEISLAIEIPSGFARDVQRGRDVKIGMWVDGSMPQRAETIKGYILGMHRGWLLEQAKYKLGVDLPQNINIETRFRYNPDVKSLPAIVPATIPILLLTIPSILAALSIVKEKELGSIINLYVTPVTRSEFIIGKQIPYIVLAMLNYLLMVGLSILVFEVPIKGGFLTLTASIFVYCIISTGIGLLASVFTKSQIAAIFLTLIITLLPATQYSGMLTPVSSLEGMGHTIGQFFPTSHMLVISRGVFSKALYFKDIYHSFNMLLIAVPFIMGLAILLLKKQDS